VRTSSKAQLAVTWQIGEASDDQFNVPQSSREKKDLIRALECEVSIGVLEYCGPLGDFWEARGSQCVASR
jgi:hypothetical protein